MKRWVKYNWHNILSMGMLLGALGQHPYSYFQILRWIVSGSAFYNAIEQHEKSKGWMWLFIATGILFNPIIPIHLDRETWIVIDIITAIPFLIVSLMNQNKHQQK